MLAFGNETTTHTTVWKEQPNFRGTWGILSSCLITLSLCIWSAVHLNIPADNESWQWQTLRRTKWVLVGLLAPENGINKLRLFRKNQLTRKDRIRCHDSVFGCEEFHEGYAKTSN